MKLNAVTPLTPLEYYSHHEELKNEYEEFCATHNILNFTLINQQIWQPSYSGLSFFSWEKELLVHGVMIPTITIRTSNYK